MFNKCILKRFIKKYQVWPSGYQVWQGDRDNRDLSIDSFHVGDLNISNHSMQQKFDIIRDQCNALLFKPECDQLFVKVRIDDIFFRKTGLTAIVLNLRANNFSCASNNSSTQSLTFLATSVVQSMHGSVYHFLISRYFFLSFFTY